MIDFEEGETANFSSEFLQRGVITIRAFQNQRLTGDGLTCPLLDGGEREREREEEAEDGLAIHPN